MLEDRIKTLQDLSDLLVKIRKHNGELVIEFYDGKIPVKTCFTYAKAKLFAEGVAFGRSSTNVNG